MLLNNSSNHVLLPDNSEPKRLSTIHYAGVFRDHTKKQVEILCSNKSNINIPTSSCSFSPVPRPRSTTTQKKQFRVRFSMKNFAGASPSIEIIDPNNIQKSIGISENKLKVAVGELVKNVAMNYYKTNNTPFGDNISDHSEADRDKQYTLKTVLKVNAEVYSDILLNKIAPFLIKVGVSVLVDDLLLDINLAPSTKKKMGKSTTTMHNVFNNLMSQLFEITAHNLTCPQSDRGHYSMNCANDKFVYSRPTYWEGQSVKPITNHKKSSTKRLKENYLKSNILDCICSSKKEQNCICNDQIFDLSQPSPQPSNIKADNSRRIGKHKPLLKTNKFKYFSKPNTKQHLGNPNLTKSLNGISKSELRRRLSFFVKALEKQKTDENSRSSIDQGLAEHITPTDVSSSRLRNRTIFSHTESDNNLWSASSETPMKDRPTSKTVSFVVQSPKQSLQEGDIQPLWLTKAIPNRMQSHNNILNEIYMALLSNNINEILSLQNLVENLFSFANIDDGQKQSQTASYNYNRKTKHLLHNTNPSSETLPKTKSNNDGKSMTKCSPMVLSEADRYKQFCSEINWYANSNCCPEKIFANMSLGQLTKHQERRLKSISSVSKLTEQISNSDFLQICFSDESLFTDNEDKMKKTPKTIDNSRGATGDDFMHLTRTILENECNLVIKSVLYEVKEIVMLKILAQEIGDKMCNTTTPSNNGYLLDELENETILNSDNHIRRHYEGKEHFMLKNLTQEICDKFCNSTASNSVRYLLDELENKAMLKSDNYHTKQLSYNTESRADKIILQILQITYLVLQELFYNDILDRHCSSYLEESFPSQKRQYMKTIEKQIIEEDPNLESESKIPPPNSMHEPSHHLHLEEENTCATKPPLTLKLTPPDQIAPTNDATRLESSPATHREGWPDNSPHVSSHTEPISRSATSITYLISENAQHSAGGVLAGGKLGDNTDEVVTSLSSDTLQMFGKQLDQKVESSFRISPFQISSKLISPASIDVPSTSRELKHFLSENLSKTDNMPNNDLKTQIIFDVEKSATSSLVQRPVRNDTTDCMSNGPIAKIKNQFRKLNYEDELPKTFALEENKTETIYGSPPVIENFMKSDSVSEFSEIEKSELDNQMVDTVFTAPSEKSQHSTGGNKVGFVAAPLATGTNRDSERSFNKDLFDTVHGDIIETMEDSEENGLSHKNDHTVIDNTFTSSVANLGQVTSPDHNLGLMMSQTEESTESHIMNSLSSFFVKDILTSLTSFSTPTEMFGALSLDTERVYNQELVLPIDPKAVHYTLHTFSSRGTDQLFSRDQEMKPKQIIQIETMSQETQSSLTRNLTKSDRVVLSIGCPSSELETNATINLATFLYNDDKDNEKPPKDSILFKDTSAGIPGLDSQREDQNNGDCGHVYSMAKLNPVCNDNFDTVASCIAFPKKELMEVKIINDQTKDITITNNDFWMALPLPDKESLVETQNIVLYTESEKVSHQMTDSQLNKDNIDESNIDRQITRSLTLDSSIYSFDTAADEMGGRANSSYRVPQNSIQSVTNEINTISTQDLAVDNEIKTDVMVQNKETMDHLLVEITEDGSATPNYDENVIHTPTSDKKIRLIPQLAPRTRFPELLDTTTTLPTPTPRKHGNRIPTLPVPSPHTNTNHSVGDDVVESAHLLPIADTNEGNRFEDATRSLFSDLENQLKEIQLFNFDAEDHNNMLSDHNSLISVSSKVSKDVDIYKVKVNNEQSGDLNTYILNKPFKDVFETSQDVNNVKVIQLKDNLLLVHQGNEGNALLENIKPFFLGLESSSQSVPVLDGTSGALHQTPETFGSETLSFPLKSSQNICKNSGTVLKETDGKGFEVIQSIESNGIIEQPLHDDVSNKRHSYNDVTYEQHLCNNVTSKQHPLDDVTIEQHPCSDVINKKYISNDHEQHTCDDLTIQQDPCNDVTSEQPLPDDFTAELPLQIEAASVNLLLSQGSKMVKSLQSTCNESSTNNRTQELTKASGNKYETCISESKELVVEQATKKLPLFVQSCLQHIFQDDKFDEACNMEPLRCNSTQTELYSFSVKTELVQTEEMCVFDEDPTTFSSESLPEDFTFTKEITHPGQKEIKADLLKTSAEDQFVKCILDKMNITNRILSKSENKAKIRSDDSTQNDVLSISSIVKDEYSPPFDKELEMAIVSSLRIDAGESVTPIAEEMHLEEAANNDAPKLTCVQNSTQTTPQVSSPLLDSIFRHIFQLVQKQNNVTVNSQGVDQSEIHTMCQHILANGQRSNFDMADNTIIAAPSLSKESQTSCDNILFKTRSRSSTPKTILMSSKDLEFFAATSSLPVVPNKFSGQRSHPQCDLSNVKHVSFNDNTLMLDDLKNSLQELPQIGGKRVSFKSNHSKRSRKSSDSIIDTTVHNHRDWRTKFKKKDAKHLLGVLTASPACHASSSITSPRFRKQRKICGSKQSQIHYLSKQTNHSQEPPAAPRVLDDSYSLQQPCNTPILLEVRPTGPFTWSNCLPAPYIPLDQPNKLDSCSSDENIEPEFRFNKVNTASDSLLFLEDHQRRTPSSSPVDHLYRSSLYSRNALKDGVFKSSGSGVFQSQTASTICFNDLMSESIVKLNQTIKSLNPTMHDHRKQTALNKSICQKNNRLKLPLYVNSPLSYNISPSTDSSNNNNSSSIKEFYNFSNSFHYNHQMVFPIKSPECSMYDQSRFNSPEPNSCGYSVILSCEQDSIYSIRNIKTPIQMAYLDNDNKNEFQIYNYNFQNSLIS